MTIQCSFHPSRPANFQCNKCNSTFCGHCISRRTYEQYGHKNTAYICPICNIQAEFAGISNFIDPFWDRMPKFFSYPAQRQPLLLIFSLALITAFFPASVIIQLLFFVISTKYAYAIMTTTAKGNLQAPAITLDLLNKNIEQVFKQYVVFFLFGVAGSFIQNAIGGIGTILFSAFVTIFLPAIIMLLVATDSITAALNPMIFVPVVTRIGWRYFLMYAFLILLPTAPAALIHYMPDILPQFLQIFLQVSFQHYYTFIAYNLMGYVLLQYHEEIGYEVDYDFFLKNSVEEGEQQQLSPNAQFQNVINIMIKSGRNEEAIEAILEKTKGKFDEEDVELSGKFLTLLKVCQRSKGIAHHAPNHLDLLVRLGKKTKAFELFDEMFSGSGTLEPSAKSFVKIADWFHSRHDYKKAISCYARFIQSNSKHPALPEAYFALLKILHEHASNTPKAKLLANGLIQQYPDHALIPEVKSYLGAMG